jgi:putative redox protein
MESNNNDPNKTIVRETGAGPFTQEIIVRQHILHADEPVTNGGNDAGPSPYDFLLAALGACTSMTVRAYAQFKKIPLKKITVTLTHQKIYAQDCEHCENSDSKLDHIERLIELQGDLTQEQRERLLDIANKCPVHRTLTSKNIITTKLVEDNIK